MVEMNCTRPKPFNCHQNVYTQVYNYTSTINTCANIFEHAHFEIITTTTINILQIPIWTVTLFFIEILTL